MEFPETHCWADASWWFPQQSSEADRDGTSITKHRENSISFMYYIVRGVVLLLPVWTPWWYAGPCLYWFRRVGNAFVCGWWLAHQKRSWEWEFERWEMREESVENIWAFVTVENLRKKLLQGCAAGWSMGTNEDLVGNTPNGYLSPGCSQAPSWIGKLERSDLELELQ